MKVTLKQSERRPSAVGLILLGPLQPCLNLSEMLRSGLPDSV